MRASETAYQLLRDEIIQWKLEPGTPLGEVETSLRLGVSRTPLREALSRLIAEGLVRTGPGRTAVVTSLSRGDIVELFELREALETQSARLAARRRERLVFESLRADFLAGARGAKGASTVSAEDRPYVLADALDLAIDEAAASVYLRGALRDLRGHLARVRRSAHSNSARLARAMTEHILIVDAILAQDEALAASATSVHLHNSLENILASLPEDAE
ncbi:MAG TPA: GntR family transcriptional regulator [Galbitalea sp.]|jgi:DNA-binding GntR family transcriptional regulator|nr:GntR family transcriptional regulator [Galbitalea sp.]